MTTMCVSACTLVRLNPVARTPANGPSPARLRLVAPRRCLRSARAIVVVKANKAEYAFSSSKKVVELSVTAIKGLAETGIEVFQKYDVNGDGKLSITECTALLNGQEITAAVQKLGLEHTQRTEEDLQKWFKRADFNHDGVLSKREFAVLYVGLLADKTKMGAKTVAGMVIAVLDKDGDGEIASDTFKDLLKLCNLNMVANLIPSGKKINYRKYLGDV